MKRLDITTTEAVSLRAGESTRSETWRVSCDSLTISDARPSAAAISAPDAVANAVLTALKAGELTSIAGQSTATNRQLLEEIHRQGAAHPRYPSIFGENGLARLARDWNGTIGPVRYPSPAQAWVAFGNSPGEVHVVVLVLEDGAWRFQDIHRVISDRF